MRLSNVYLARGSDIGWEEFPREEQWQCLDTKLDTDHQETGGEEAGQLQAEQAALHHGRPLQHGAGDEVGEGGEEEQADDGEDEGGEVHGPAGECHQDSGQGERCHQSEISLCHWMITDN